MKEITPLQLAKVHAARQAANLMSQAHSEPYVNAEAILHDMGLTESKINEILERQQQSLDSYAEVMEKQQELIDAFNYQRKARIELEDRIRALETAGESSSKSR